MLHVHRAERADRLADGLAETLLEPLEDPFAPEVVAVPTRGIERWLTQRLSTRLGTTRRPSGRGVRERRVPVPRAPDPGSARGRDRDRPGRRPVAGRALGLAAARGRRRVPRRAVAGHARAPPRGRARRARRTRSRRFGVRPPHRRPVRPLRRAPPGDGPGLGAGERDRQDARLAGRAVAAPARADRRPEPGRAARHRRASGSASDPGLARPPGAAVAVRADAAAALATSRSWPRSPTRRDVHLFVLHPSPALWASGRRGARSDGPPIVDRRDDRTAALPVNRLLASWGRDVRELQLVLAGAGDGVDHHHGCPRPEPTTLLERSRPTSARTASRPGRRSRASRDARPRPARRTTAASRSTPATAARARSRCCATRSSTCSRTTRRSSRAT